MRIYAICDVNPRDGGEPLHVGFSFLLSPDSQMGEIDAVDFLGNLNDDDKKWLSRFKGCSFILGDGYVHIPEYNHPDPIITITGSQILSANSSPSH